MEKTDIKITFACNNHCKFCVQGDKRNLYRAKSRVDVKKYLRESYKNNKREVVFTGGEPCLHPQILDLISDARKIGFKEIQLQTNGRMFFYPEFCTKLIRAGVTEFAPSLHGHTAKIHDFLTEANGSFKQTIQGIKNLKKLNQYVLTNTVITSSNYKFLPQIAKLLVSLGVNQFQFAFIHISGSAENNKDWLVPKKSEIMPYVKRGLDIGLKAKKKVMTEAIPYCLMKGYEDCIAEKMMPRASVYDADFKITDFLQYRINEGKAKGPNCARCKMNDICEGPWKEYPQMFGWEEFRPIDSLN